jgi:3-oxoacyl-[acyl-carrier-protein] synthase I
MPTRLTALNTKPCRLFAPAVVCPLGADLQGISEALFSGRRGLVHDDAFTPGRPLPLGRVHAPLPAKGAWPPEHRSRNNQLLAAALERLRPTLEKFLRRRPTARIGVILGTSTSGIAETGDAVVHRQRTGRWPEEFRYERHEIGSPARFVADMLGLDGPAYTLSTACTSSARALASAKRLVAAGVCDAVIAGGADSLCSLTVHGFASLEALSDAPCQPFSANRAGINLGEAAVLFLVAGEGGGIQLRSYGETSDAHHISAPRPDGEGARAAMQAALDMASVSAEAIDYLNLHGTATRQNDKMEAAAVAKLLGARVPVSSTKALTGHTLGAAGALEAAFCWLALEAGRLPPHVSDGAQDPELAELHYASATRGSYRRTLSNSFAFGGNNIALLLERSS